MYFYSFSCCLNKKEIMIAAHMADGKHVHIYKSSKRKKKTAICKRQTKEGCMYNSTNSTSIHLPIYIGHLPPSQKKLHKLKL